MKSMIMAVGMLATSSSSYINMFDGLLMNVETVPGVTAMWIDAMPKIADECHLEVDKKKIDEKIYLLNRRLNSQVDTAKNLLRSGAISDAIYIRWRGIYEHDGASVACNRAIELWGANGAMYPGILVPK